MAQSTNICFTVCRIPKSLYLIRSPATIVRAMLIEPVPCACFRHDNGSSRQLLLVKCLIQFLYESADLSVLPRRALLTVAPVESRLVDRVDIGDRIAQVGEVSGCGGDIVCEIVIAIFLKVGSRRPVLVVGQSVCRIINRCRVCEKKEMINPIALGLLHEPPLSGTAVPVVGAVRLDVAVSASCGISDIRSVALFTAASPQVHSPHRESDAFGIAVAVHLL